MNLRIIIIFLLSHILAYAAFGQLKGKYCYTEGFDQECINFLDSNNFEYSYYTCGLYTSARGKFTLENRNLSLKFNTLDSTKAIVEIEKYEHLNDSAKIEIFVFDFKEKKSVSYAGLLIKDKTGKKIFASLSDENGKLGIYLPTNYDSLELNITDFVSKPTTFYINLDSSYRIKTYLKEDLTPHINEEEKMNFNIKSIKRKKILLIENNSKLKILKKAL